MIEHKIRTAAGGLEKVKLTPIKAIRKHCLECTAWNLEETRECTAIHCPLYPYRMGRRPIEG